MKIWALIVAVGVSAAVAFTLLQSRRNVVSVPVEKSVFSEEGLKMKNVQYRQNDAGAGAKWVLDAKEVRFSQDRDRVSFVNFILKVDRQDRPSLELRGDEGEYSKDSGLLHLWGNLEGWSGDGYRILTDQIVFDEKNRNLSNDRPVKIFGPYFLVEGRGLSVDLQKERFEVLSQVTAIVRKEPPI